jgi:hypothetical protein
LYPNPVTDKITLSIEGQGALYNIVDNVGKQVQSGYVDETNKIDISHLDKFAFYFVRIQVGGRWITQKIIKK